jgi:hypothetical protein
MKPTDYELQGVLDTSKAERLLGFRPSTTEAFVRETVEWHRPLLGAAVGSDSRAATEGSSSEGRGSLPPSWRPAHHDRHGTARRHAASDPPLAGSSAAQLGSIIGPGDESVIRRGDMYVERGFVPADDIQELRRLVIDPVVRTSVQLLDDWDRRLWRNSSFKLRLQNASARATRESFLEAILTRLKSDSAYVASKERQRHVHAHSRKLQQLNDLSWRVLQRAAGRVESLSFESELFDMDHRSLDASYNLAFHSTGSDFPPHVDWAPNCVAVLVYLTSEGDDFVGGRLQTRGCPGPMDCPLTRNSFMGVYATVGRPANCSAGDTPIACSVLREHVPRAGDLVVIPAESAHSVSMVTEGTRVAMNFWFNCRARNTENWAADVERLRRDAAFGECYTRRLLNAITQKTPQ